MTEVLISGSAIMAIGPFAVNEDEVRSSDAVFPKHVLGEWRIVTTKLPEDFTCASYEWADGLIPKQDSGVMTPLQREEFKARRAAAVAAIVVEVDGMKFDGDEVSQGRMARAILAMQSAVEEHTMWVLADNRAVSVRIDQLGKALALAGREQSRLWVAK